MTLPASILRDGYTPLAQARKQGAFKRLLLGTDGWPNTGKSEFAMSAPEPIVILSLDRGMDAVLDNPRPPSTRGKDVAYKLISTPFAGQMSQNEYLQVWRDFYTEYKKALDNPDVRTLVLDTDSDTWELQRLAEFGRVTQVPSLQYPAVNAARKAMIARAYDSGKIVIGINKLEHEYRRYTDASGKEKSEKTGNDVRQGFKDFDYLWQVQIRHLYDEKKQVWGLRIMRCKADTSLQGMELWGDECNFKTLVQAIYPNVPEKDWGYR